MNQNDMPKVQPLVLPTKGKGFWFRAKQAFKPRKWRLIEDFVTDIPFTNKIRCRALIPAPFDFDFASVPRPFWVVLDPVGLLLVGASFHDFGYRYGGIFLERKGGDGWVFVELKRLELDALFERINRDVNGMKFLPKLAKWAVNIGGYFSWRKYDGDVREDYPRLFKIKGATK